MTVHVHENLSNVESSYLSIPNEEVEYAEEEVRGTLAKFL